jgi:hypothetical protein
VNKNIHDQSLLPPLRRARSWRDDTITALQGLADTIMARFCDELGDVQRRLDRLRAGLRALLEEDA